MTNVVYEIANTRLKKNKEVRKAKNYLIEYLSSNDEWIMEENDDQNLDLKHQ